MSERKFGGGLLSNSSPPSCLPQAPCHPAYPYPSLFTHHYVPHSAYSKPIPTLQDSYLHPPLLSLLLVIKLSCLRRPNCLRWSFPNSFPLCGCEFKPAWKKFQSSSAKWTLFLLWVLPVDFILDVTPPATDLLPSGITKRPDHWVKGSTAMRHEKRPSPYLQLGQQESLWAEFLTVQVIFLSKPQD